jgi:membrane protein
MIAALGAAFLLVFGLLVLGPLISEWIGNALDIEGVIGWVWWIAQWPVLIAGLLAAFATVLYLGPNVDHPKWQFITPGSLIALFVWLAASGLFAIYTSMFGAYNKTWGTLAAVIVMLTWLWLTGLALLFGAEVNAEAERSRELREGQTAAADQIQAPAKA